MLKSNNMYESGIFAFQFRVTEGMTQEGKNVVFNLWFNHLSPQEEVLFAPNYILYLPIYIYQAFISYISTSICSILSLSLELFVSHISQDFQKNSKMEQLIIEDKTYKRSVKVGKHRVGSVIGRWAN